MPLKGYLIDTFLSNHHFIYLATSFGRLVVTEVFLYLFGLSIVVNVEQYGIYFEYFLETSPNTFSLMLDFFTGFTPLPPA